MIAQRAEDIMNIMSRKNLYIVSLGVWIWLLLLLNLAWLATDRTPPAWDQAAHIRSIIYVNHWLKGTFWGNFTDLIRTFWGYPPLLYFLGGVWSLVLGVSVFGITLINSVFLAGAVAGVFVLAREVTGSEGKALLAGIIFSMFPAIYDISRNVLLDFRIVWTIL